VRKALISPLRDRWLVEADDVGEMKVQGNIVDHEYTFETEDGRKIAETSKRWFRVRHLRRADRPVGRRSAHPCGHRGDRSDVARLSPARRRPRLPICVVVPPRDRALVRDCFTHGGRCPTGMTAQRWRHQRMNHRRVNQ
jgi:hypothetical protein